MSISRQIAYYEDKGFTRAQAEINVLINCAAALIFAQFPDTFVLIGGAALILLHESARLSTDLDLLARNVPLPSAQAVIDCIDRGLQPLGEVLALGPFQFTSASIADVDIKIAVTGNSGRQLFRLDLTRFGSAIESQIVAHRFEIGDGAPATIKAASRHLLLLQKAEAFLLRRGIKARDAYDIYILKQRGANLNANLSAHLSDSLRNNGIESEDIEARIEYINSRSFRSELSAILPERIYSPLARSNFVEIRAVIENLFAPWLAAERE